MIQISFEEPNRFVVHATGSVSGREALATVRKVRDDRRLGAGSTILVVAHDVTAAPAADELRDIALETRELAERGAVGIAVASKRPFMYGVARMFGSLAAAVSVQASAFTEEADARRWLDDQAADQRRSAP